MGSARRDDPFLGRHQQLHRRAGAVVKRDLLLPLTERISIGCTGGGLCVTRQKCEDMRAVREHGGFHRNRQVRGGLIGLAIDPEIAVDERVEGFLIARIRAGEWHGEINGTGPRRSQGRRGGNGAARQCGRWLQVGVVNPKVHWGAGGERVAERIARYCVHAVPRRGRVVDIVGVPRQRPWRGPHNSLRYAIDEPLHRNDVRQR